jgi:uncharacterized metal-binding protein
MVDLPQKKVGIVACSGEELAEGTVTRLAALKVREQLRPADTVTICLPLFLAGGEGDRAFARFYPTIAVDGCDKRCAAKGTEMYSGKPAVSLVVSDLMQEAGLEKPQGCRHLDEAGKKAIDLTAAKIAENVDELLGKGWNRRTGGIDLPVLNASSSKEEPAIPVEPVIATCSCGSGIPVKTVYMLGQVVTLVALPVILQKAADMGRAPGGLTSQDLLAELKIYNPVPQDKEPAYLDMLDTEYAAFLKKVTRR